MMRRTLVLQSHRDPLPAHWLGRCLASVENWAGAAGYEYRFIGDELFDPIPDHLRERLRGQPVVASDIARLLALRAALEEGFEAVVWCDADFLVFEPERLALPAESYAVGREVWIEDRGGGRTPRARVKVHNAFLLFRRRNPFLDFAIHALLRLLAAHPGPYPPQFAGPKLLTALHNIVGFPVAERAGMLSPPVIRDLVAGGGPCLELFRERSPEPAASANLCASLAGGREMTDSEVEAAIDALTRSIPSSSPTPTPT
ncbi:hypothetical protein [Lentisalinibacter salinarum]|uniref:hypothetical protein n=1 Tax=Lentisalinibacter salinarum TaxID=2992239 RepID=UPI00386B13C8